MTEVHPLTAYIPERAKQGDLVARIDLDGFSESVVLYERKIIEGRVRYRAALDAGVEPTFREWVGVGEDDPLDWMVRHHVETHELNELDKIKLVAAVLPFYRNMKGQTNQRLYAAFDGLSWNKIRAINWLEEAGALDGVLSGEEDVYEAARRLGLAPDKRAKSLGKSFGAGDQFDGATLPIKQYLAAWKRKGYEFRHLNPKEAQRRVLVFQALAEELQVALKDLEKRAVTATLSAPPERKRK